MSKQIHRKHSNKNIENDKIIQTKYNRLNMKVQDMLKGMGLDLEKIDFIDNPDEIKMSAVILKLAEPYIKMYWGNESRVRGIIFLTIAVWNMDFLPQKEQIELQEKWIADILPNDCDAQDVATMLHVFENLQKQKGDLFPDIQTFIMGHELRLDSKNIHLDISSVPLGKKAS